MKGGRIERALRGLVSVGVVGAIVASGAPAWSVNYKPFTKVEDVCPKCPKRASDTITLNSSAEVRAKIVAENNDFVVLTRYGEVRALPKSRVQSVEWANNSQPSGLTSQDQIVLRSGHVLTGSIIEEKSDPGYFRLQSSINQQTFVVFNSQIESVYKAGSRYQFGS